MTRAEAQAVRAFIVGTVCLKMSKAVALKICFPVAEVIRLQWSESKLAIQGSLYIDLVYQLGPSQCSLYFLREGGWRWRWRWSGLPWETGISSSFLR